MRGLRGRGAVGGTWATWDAPGAGRAGAALGIGIFFARRTRLSSLLYIASSSFPTRRPRRRRHRP